MVMPYRDLYQPPQRRTATSDQAAASPQPNGVSFVEHMRRLHPPNIDASMGLNESERRQVREWRRLIDANLLGFGTIIPAHLLAAVYDGCAPQGAPSLLEAASDPTARIARQITAGMSMRASLATDHAPQRRLATDGDHTRPTMSYRLKQIMGDYELLDEDTFGAEMDRWGITNTMERIALKSEALGLRMMRARGTPLPAPQKARQYHPIPGVDDPKSQHFVDKDAKEATKSTAGPLTIQASDASGRAAYDKTWISL